MGFQRIFSGPLGGYLLFHRHRRMVGEGATDSRRRRGVRHDHLPLVAGWGQSLVTVRCVWDNSEGWKGVSMLVLTVKNS